LRRCRRLGGGVSRSGGLVATGTASYRTHGRVHGRMDEARLARPGLLGPANPGLCRLGHRGDPCLLNLTVRVGRARITGEPELRSAETYHIAGHHPRGADDPPAVDEGPVGGGEI